MSSYEYRSKKVVATIASDIESGAAMNVLGHLALAIGAYADQSDLMGRDRLRDASGHEHLGIAKYPFIITKGKSSQIRRLVEAARDENVLLADHPMLMLTTGHDDELAEAVAGTKEAEFDYYGAVLFGDYDIVSKLTKKFSLWR